MVKMPKQPDFESISLVPSIIGQILGRSSPMAGQLVSQVGVDAVNEAAEAYQKAAQEAAKKAQEEAMREAQRAQDEAMKQAQEAARRRAQEAQQAAQEAQQKAAQEAQRQAQEAQQKAAEAAQKAQQEAAQQSQQAQQQGQQAQQDAQTAQQEAAARAQAEAQRQAQQAQQQAAQAAAQAQQQAPRADGFVPDPDNPGAMIRPRGAQQPEVRTPSGRTTGQPKPPAPWERRQQTPPPPPDPTQNPNLQPPRPQPVLGLGTPTQFWPQPNTPSPIQSGPASRINPLPDVSSTSVASRPMIPTVQHPIWTAIQMRGLNKPGQGLDPKQIAAGLATGKDTMNIGADVARMAWADEKRIEWRNNPAILQQAPQDYIESWLGMWRANEAGAPLSNEARRELIAIGMPPSVAPVRAGVAPSASPADSNSQPSSSLANYPYANLTIPQQVQAVTGTWRGLTNNLLNPPTLPGPPQRGRMPGQGEPEPNQGAGTYPLQPSRSARRVDDPFVANRPAYVEPDGTIWVMAPSGGWKHGGKDPNLFTQSQNSGGGPGEPPSRGNLPQARQVQVGNRTFSTFQNERGSGIMDESGNELIWDENGRLVPSGRRPGAEDSQLLPANNVPPGGFEQPATFYNNKGTTPEAADPAGASPGNPSRLTAFGHMAPLTAASYDFFSRQQGGTLQPDITDDAVRNLAGAIVSGEQYAAPAAESLARLAWYRESGGREGPPEAAPASYIRNWIGAWRNGQDVPLAAEIGQQVREQGISPPSRVIATGNRAAPQTSQPMQTQVARGADLSTLYPLQGPNMGDPAWNALCGPVAAMGALAALGIKTDLPTAKQRATAVGWTARSGMAGPQSEVALLDSYGVKSRAGAIDIAEIKRRADQGIPTLLSSPGASGHYFVVQAVDDQGRMDLGNSAMALRASGGKRHYTVQEMKSQLGTFGQVNAAIYIEGTPQQQQQQPQAPPMATFSNPPAQAAPQAVAEWIPVRSKSNKVDRWISSADFDPSLHERISPTLPSLRPKPQQAPPARQSSASPPDPRVATMSMSDTGSSDVMPTNPWRDAWSTDGRPAPPPITSTGRRNEQLDPRIEAAASENLWSSNQGNRQALMVEWQAKPIDERRQVFESAMERALDEEKITDPNQREQWKQGMRILATGDGLPRGKHGENPALNPYMIAGESNGKPGTANALNSSALGYFQFIKQNPDGSPYGHEQHLPDEYKNRPYDPVGQVRQYIRAIMGSTKHRGDPMGPAREKIRNANGSWGP